MITDTDVKAIINAAIKKKIILCHQRNFYNLLTLTYPHMSYWILFVILSIHLEPFPKEKMQRSSASLKQETRSLKKSAVS